MLVFPAKVLRARVIKKYMKQAGYSRAVCFSCGNASRELIRQGVVTVEVSPNGLLSANRWLSPEQVHELWPDCFDATSGHLPAFLMKRIAEEYRIFLGTILHNPCEVPTGSGETIICLSWAFPSITFIPKYGLDKSTIFNEQAPLNYVVNSIVVRNNPEVLLHEKE